MYNSKQNKCWVFYIFLNFLKYFLNFIKSFSKISNNFDNFQKHFLNFLNNFLNSLKMFLNFLKNILSFLYFRSKILINFVNIFDNFYLKNFQNLNFFFNGRRWLAPQTLGNGPPMAATQMTNIIGWNNFTLNLGF